MIKRKCDAKLLVTNSFDVRMSIVKSRQTNKQTKNHFKGQENSFDFNFVILEIDYLKCQNVKKKKQQQSIDVVFGITFFTHCNDYFLAYFHPFLSISFCLFFSLVTCLVFVLRRQQTFDIFDNSLQFVCLLFQD